MRMEIDRSVLEGGLMLDIVIANRLDVGLTVIVLRVIWMFIW